MKSAPPRQLMKLIVCCSAPSEINQTHQTAQFNKSKKRTQQPIQTTKPKKTTNQSLSILECFEFDQIHQLFKQLSLNPIDSTN